jgi:predicted transcriptional regulator
LRRSKIEIFVDILNVMVLRDSLKLTHIMQKANINHCVLQESLGFLIKQEMIEKRTVEKQHVAYAITQRGIMVIKYFKKLERQPRPRIFSN